MTKLWLVCGALLGFIGGCAQPDAKSSPVDARAIHRSFTCSMHPQVIESRGGQCPLCGMGLTPVNTGEHRDGWVRIDPVVVQNLGVRVAPVIEGRLTRTIRLHGAVRRDSDFFVSASLFQHQLPFISVGQKARIRFSAFPGTVFRGDVTSVSTELDSLTHTASARIDLESASPPLLASLQGTVEITSVSPDETLLIPRDAILDTGTRKLVFIAHDGGAFEPRELRVGAAAEEWAQALGGVHKGESVVVSGQLLLDNESRVQQALEKYQRGEWVPKPKSKPAGHS